MFVLLNGPSPCQNLQEHSVAALVSLDSDSRGYSIGVSKGPHRRYALQKITLMWPPYRLVYVAPPKKLQYTPELCHCNHDSEGPFQNCSNCFYREWGHRRVTLWVQAWTRTVPGSSFDWPIQNFLYTLHYTRSQTIRHRLKLNQLVCILVYQPVSDKHDWYVYLVIFDVGIMFAYHILSMKLCLSV